MAPPGRTVQGSETLEGALIEAVRPALDALHRYLDDVLAAELGRPGTRHRPNPDGDRICRAQRLAELADRLERELGELTPIYKGLRPDKGASRAPARTERGDG